MADRKVTCPRCGWWQYESHAGKCPQCAVMSHAAGAARGAAGRVTATEILESRRAMDEYLRERFRLLAAKLDEEIRHICESASRALRR